MRANLRFWLALSLLLVAGAIFVRWQDRSETTVQMPGAAAQQLSKAAQAPELLTTPGVISTYLASRGEAQPETAASKTNRAAYQLSNVKESIGELSRRDSGILMRNALIDTREAVALGIPEHLKAGAHPGAYIVQSRNTKAGPFQEILKAAGAEVVAYVPNNAYLVKASSEVAQKLQTQMQVASVLPYEPYYKIDSRLLKAAVEQQPLDPTTWLRITLFPGASGDSIQPLARQVGIREPSPFGEQVLVNLLSDRLPKLAQLPEVQIIEPWNPRIAANDLTRVRMGVSETQLTNTTYLNLRGANVILNINDIGVDSTHPDLVGKVLYHGDHAKLDPDGHGTHVAATIIGSGLTNPPVFDNLKDHTNQLTQAILTDDEGNPVSTNWVVNGSPTNVSLRGLAPDAKLFALPVDFSPDVNSPVTDSFLIETAARTNYFTMGRTNTLISNNSWNYANTTDYDSQAARFDAATRDAVMTETGPQPVLYIFAAGNNGFGDEEGLGGDPGRITSPGTAKNVLTIGALETPRFISEGLTITTIITNEEVDPPTKITNTTVTQIFMPTTDSQSEVASFSSRGNVGIGVEGSHGRFKPDLVAPGTFILSAKSKQWNLTNDFNPAVSETISNIYNVVSNLNAVSTLYRYDSGTSFSVPAVSGVLALVQEFFGQRLPDNLRRNLSPAMMKALLINSARNVHERYDFEVDSVINYQGWGLVNLKSVLSSNMLTAPEKDWELQMVEQSVNNAVATGEAFSWDVGFTTNSQASPLRVTLVWTDPPGNPTTGLKLVNDLDLVIEAGGYFYHGNDIISQSRFNEPRDPAFDTNSAFGVFWDSPYRDNVNNVENIFIPGGLGTNITIHVIGRRVNVKAIHDVYNALGEHNEIKQDFALVVSSAYRGVDLAENLVPPFVKFERQAAKQLFDFRHVTPVTNGVPLLNQRVGANSPLYSVNGAISQWNFYIFTNNNDNVAGMNSTKPGKYVAFITYTPPNLSIPRTLEADLDMYVSKDPALTNLAPSAVNAAFKSRGRLGSEQVVFTPDNIIRDHDGNDTGERTPVYVEGVGGPVIGVATGLPTEVFYIAIKSEDQQGAEFSLIGVSSDQPFEEKRGDVTVLMATPLQAVIPDGLPNAPKAGTAIAIGLSNKRTRDATIFMTIAHEEYGDLVGVMRHGNTRSILNNHSLFNENFTGVNSFIFSDDPYLNRTALPSIEQFPADLRPPALTQSSYMYADGPGLLGAYAGANITGPWIFEMIDNAFSHTGRVDRLEVHVKPIEDPLLSGQTVQGRVDPNGQNFYVFDVSPDASKVALILKQLTQLGLSLEMYVRRDLIPGTNTGAFDYSVIRQAPADSVTLTIDTNTAPPLIPGEYFIVIVNRNSQAIDFELTFLEELNSNGLNDLNNAATNVKLLDDAKSGSVFTVRQDLVVTDTAVAIAAPHLRTSDYVFYLVSPQGTRVLLSENRGYFSEDGFGNTNRTTNGQRELFDANSYAVFTDDPVAELPIKFQPLPYGDGAITRGFIYRNGFENIAEQDFTPPTAFGGGWTTDIGRVTVVTRPDAHSGTNFLNLGDGAISRTIPTRAGRNYKLTFAYREHGYFNTGLSANRTPRPPGITELHYRLTQTAVTGGSGSDLFVAMTNQFAPGWMPNTTNSQWISINAAGNNSYPAGTYTIRHSFVGNELGLLGGTMRIRFAGDGNTSLFYNGIPQATGNNSTAAFSPYLILPVRPGLNTADFVITQFASDPIGWRAEFEPTLLVNTQAVGIVRLIGASATNSATVTGAGDWRIYKTEFNASQDDMTLQFATSPNFPGIDLDTIELTDTGTIFIQPEEPLAVLDGERAMGDWRLETWDNRTGQVATTNVTEWQLLLSTAPAVLPAEQLEKNVVFPTDATNSVAVRNATYFTPGTTRRGEVHWFYYDVCNDATVVNIEVRPATANRGTLQLMVDRSGFPTALAARDDYPIQIVATNRSLNFTLSTNAPAAAPLQQGKRLFFAIRNSNFSRTNTFEVLITSDGTCTIPLPPSPIRAASIASDGHFKMTFATTPGKTYEVSTSSDLINWNVVETPTAIGGETTYTDPDPADKKQRFYRIKQLD